MKKHTAKRNPYMDLSKFVLACLVIFIHFPEESAAGEAIDCLARLAVPFFFMVSGYYSMFSDAGKMCARAVRNAGLLFFSLLFYGVWDCWRTVVLYHGFFGEVLERAFSARSAKLFLLFGVTPFTTHLWFLCALVAAYLMAALLRVMGWKPGTMPGWAKITVIVLLLGHFAVSLGVPLLTGQTVVNHMYRNYWLFGFPMFLLGMWIRSVPVERIAETFFSRCCLICMLVFGVGLGEMQWFLLGKAEMPAGIFFATAALFCLVAACDGKKTTHGMAVCSDVLGRASMWIYILHRFIGHVIFECRRLVPALNLLCEKEFGLTMAALICSVSIGIIFALVERSIR